MWAISELTGRMESKTQKTGSEAVGDIPDLVKKAAQEWPGQGATVASSGFLCWHQS
jgi:hypothetical protein